MARFVGTLVLLYGFLLFVLTAAYWASLQPPGSTVGPPSFIQDLTLKLAEGIYLAAFGSVLIIGGSLLQRNEGRSRAQSVRSTHRRSLLLVAAVAIIVAAAIVGRLPPSQRSVSFEPSDFALCEAPTTPPCSNYTVSVAGYLLIVDQQSHVPVQLALGVAGSACIAATLFHPGIGRRVTVSR